MKKIILLLSLLFLIGAGGFYFYEQMRQDPPVESKFVQNVKEEAKESTETSNNNPLETANDRVNAQSVDVIEPGNYALVALPTHTYQTFNNCGPATLTMLLNFYGQNVTQDILGKEMRPYQNPQGDNDDKTIFSYEFVEWAESYGLNALERVNGDIDLLKRFTANGIPVAVKTWLKSDDDVGHFRIVRGFDETRQVIIQDDSYQGPNRHYSYYEFLSLWQPFNYNYIVVYTDEQEDVVNEILGSEQDPKAAWRNALTRAIRENELDSNNPYPLFNQSTSYYQIGEYEKSIEAFEKVESRLPRRMLWYQIEPILAYKKTGNHNRVFSIINNILENGNRAYSELYYLRGEIYQEQNNLDKAREQFELAITYNKNYKKAQEALKNL